MFSGAYLNKFSDQCLTLVQGIQQVTCFFAWRQKQSQILWKFRWWTKSKKKIVSVDFGHALFSHVSTYGDLTMQVMVWFRMAQFRAMKFGAVWFSAHIQI
jgi:hypothetical protein